MLQGYRTHSHVALPQNTPDRMTPSILTWLMLLHCSCISSTFGSSSEQYANQSICHKVGSFKMYYTVLMVLNRVLFYLCSDDMKNILCFITCIIIDVIRYSCMTFTYSVYLFKHSSDPLSCVSFF